jgi:hypothetical protein
MAEVAIRNIAPIKVDRVLVFIALSGVFLPAAGGSCLLVMAVAPGSQKAVGRCSCSAVSRQWIACGDVESKDC